MSRNLENWPSGLVRAPNGIIHIVESGFPNWEGILFRRQIIAKDGVLDSSFSGAADQEFIGRIARNYDFYVSKNVCAKFTHHSESWTSKRADELVQGRKEQCANNIERQNDGDPRLVVRSGSVSS